MTPGRFGPRMPSFKCKDIGMECGFEASALLRGGLMKKIQQHAASAHNLSPIPADVQAKIDANIR